MKIDTIEIQISTPTNDYLEHWSYHHTIEEAIAELEYIKQLPDREEEEDE